LELNTTAIPSAADHGKKTFELNTTAIPSAADHGKKEIDALPLVDSMSTKDAVEWCQWEHKVPLLALGRNCLMTQVKAESWLFRNVALIDPSKGELDEGMSIAVEGGLIKEVGRGELTFSGAQKVDASGVIMMPGLIDCHVHVTAVEASPAANAALPSSYIALRAARVMEGMLRRGFTTVRDVGGADYGLVKAVNEGFIKGPRLVISGKALSQTCGHADFRGIYDEQDASYFTRRLGSMGRVCDGVTAVRQACREELKAGAAFIKIMANGGVASPSDPIDFLQFSREEIAAIVEEATNARTYVAAHLYTDEAIRRAVELGVHSIEHCNLVSPETAALMAENGAIACPTLITHQAMADEALNFGLSEEVVKRTERVREAGLSALSILKQAGVTMAYGSDLLGPMHYRQSEEFSMRGRVLPASDIIAAATVNAAKLLKMEEQIGRVAPGAFADLIAVRGNPLSDISILSNPQDNIAMVMKGGNIVFDNMLSER
jgi:imidazolonepropionase-like amidohydrolase